MDEGRRTRGEGARRGKRGPEMRSFARFFGAVLQQNSIAFCQNGCVKINRIGEIGGCLGKIGGAQN